MDILQYIEMESMFGPAVVETYKLIEVFNDRNFVNIRDALMYGPNINMLKGALTSSTFTLEYMKRLERLINMGLLAQDPAYIEFAKRVEKYYSKHLTETVCDIGGIYPLRMIFFK